MSLLITTKAKSLCFPLFLVAFSLIYLVSSLALGAPLENGRLTPSFFPLILGAISTALTLVILVRALKQSSTEEEWSAAKKGDEARKIDKYLTFFVIAATALYIVLFPTLGYFATSFLYVFSIIIIFSNLSKLLSKSLLAIAVVVLGYLLFEQVFRVRLPTVWG